MQIVIDIPDELKRALDNNEEYRLYTESVGHVILTAIKNGAPLPEHHSDLIERDAVFKCNCQNNFSECDTCANDSICNLVNEAPTIIPATETPTESDDDKYTKVPACNGYTFYVPKQTATKEGDRE